MVITSPSNPRIKYAVRLRERRDREQERLMLIEGREELALALHSGAHLRTLFICPRLMGTPDREGLSAQAQQAGAEIIEVSPPVFEKLAYRENPDGWLGLAPMPAWRLTDLRLPDAPLVVVAEAVEKPGNLGAILRSADAAGVDAVIVCDPTTDLSNPNVVRASRGALFTVPVAQATGAETRAWLQARRFTIIAATPQATRPYYTADWRGAVALALGTEKHGLSRAWLEQAGQQVRIPMRGRINSLNVSTAATLLMYAAVQQRESAA